MEKNNNKTNRSFLKPYQAEFPNHSFSVNPKRIFLMNRKQEISLTLFCLKKKKKV